MKDMVLSQLRLKREGRGYYSEPPPPPPIVVNVSVGGGGDGNHESKEEIYEELQRAAIAINSFQPGHCVGNCTQCTKAVVLEKYQENGRHEFETTDISWGKPATAFFCSIDCIQRKVVHKKCLIKAASDTHKLGRSFDILCSACNHKIASDAPPQLTVYALILGAILFSAWLVMWFYMPGLIFKLAMYGVDCIRNLSCPSSFYTYSVKYRICVDCPKLKAVGFYWDLGTQVVSLLVFVVWRTIWLLWDYGIPIARWLFGWTIWILGYVQPLWKQKEANCYVRNMEGKKISIKKRRVLRGGQ
jgi:hypothetical protein